MTGYEEFQQIMANIKYKLADPNANYIPAGFEEIFQNIKRD